MLKLFTIIVVIFIRIRSRIQRWIWYCKSIYSNFNKIA